MRAVMPMLPAAAFLLALAVTSARAATVTPRLEVALLAAGSADELPVIVTVAGKVDPRWFRDPDRRRRRRAMVETLRGHAELAQGAVAAALEGGRGRRLRRLWIANGLAVSLTPDAIRALARRADVERVELDATVQVPQTAAAAPGPVEWNLDLVGAPVLWALGFTGQQRVVATMDTGVDLAHPDLGPRWRGGTNSWFDPNGQHAAPTDVDGHGTSTMSLMVGGAAGGSSIGVAPGAQWIAAKIFDDGGHASFSAIHLAFQWLLDPDGDPATDDAPDVVSDSWDLSGTVGTCVTEFEPDIGALEAAGIPVVFAGGNHGPGPSTSTSPGNNGGSIAVGAVDASATVADFSSRGPSACDGSLYPRVVAPGLSVRVADLTFGGLFPQSYVYLSGTSFAAPHVAAGLVLLGSAFPEASATELQTAIDESARDLAPAGPDYGAGHGLLDLAGAYARLAGRVVQVVERRIATAADDAEERLGTGATKLGSSDLQLTVDGSAQTVGLRFPGLPIPRGAHIERAYLQFQAKKATAVPTGLTITAQAAGSAPAFRAKKRDLSSRARTVQSVAWPAVAAWLKNDAGPEQRTRDFAPVVQEIVDRGDWSEGNALALFVDGAGQRVAYSYDGKRTATPLLHVEYRSIAATGPATTTTTTPSVTSTSLSTTTTTTTTSTSTPSTSLPPALPITAVLADTYTHAGQSGTNFSASPELSVEVKPEQRIYVRVQVSYLGAAVVTRAYLQLDVAGSSNADSAAGGRIQRINDCTWSENSLTFANQPALDGTPGPDVGAVGVTTPARFDVTNVVQAGRDGVYCFAITSSSSNRATYRSSQAATGRPQFVVQVTP